MKLSLVERETILPVSYTHLAPSSFEFRTGKQFRMGKKYGAVSFLQILAPVSYTHLAN